MNRLPKVLQNEIWEYVHGDRAFFKQQFQIVMTELSVSDLALHLTHAKMLQNPASVLWVNGNGIYAPTDLRDERGWAVIMEKSTWKRHRGKPWRVWERHQLKRSAGYFRFEDARAEFHRQVVIAATKTFQKQQQQLLAGRRGRQ